MSREDKRQEESLKANYAVQRLVHFTFNLANHVLSKCVDLNLISSPGRVPYGMCPTFVSCFDNWTQAKSSRKQGGTSTEEISPSDWPVSKSVVACLWLMIDVEGPNSLWVVPPLGILPDTKNQLRKPWRTSHQAGFLHGSCSCLCSWSGLPQWWSMIRTCKLLNKLFPLQAAFGHGVYHSNRKQVVITIIPVQGIRDRRTPEACNQPVQPNQPASGSMRDIVSKLKVERYWGKQLTLPSDLHICEHVCM